MTGRRLRDRNWGPHALGPSGSRAPTDRRPRTTSLEKRPGAFAQALPAENVVTGAFRDCGHLRNQVVGHLQFLQRCTEVLDDGIEVGVVEALLDQGGLWLSPLHAWG